MFTRPSEVAVLTLDFKEKRFVTLFLTFKK